MLKNLLAISLCIWISYSICAQNADRIDSSLKEVMKSVDDTIKVRKLLDVAMSSFEIRSKAALKAAQESEALAVRLNYKQLNIYIFGSLAYYYYLEHNYPDALNYYFKGLHLAEEQGNYFLAARYNNYIGTIHHEQRNYILAKGFYHLAYSCVRKLNDENSKAMRAIISNMGMIDVVLKNYVQGEAYLFESIRLARKNNDEVQEAIALNHLGLAYTNTHRYDKALSCLNRSLAISIKNGDGRQMGYDYIGIGNIYFNMKRYDQAIASYKLSVEKAVEIGDLRLESGNYQQMGYASALTNKYKDAYEYILLFKQVSDSLFSEDKNRFIVEMNAKYETEKKDHEIHRLAVENIYKEDLANKQKRIIYLITGALSVFVLLLFFLIKNVRQKNIAYYALQEKNELISEQKEKIEMQKMLLESHNMELQQENVFAQFETLKNQVNPHFLFNCLTVLCSLIKKDPEKAYHFAKEFSNIYRVVLEYKKRLIIPLSEELTFVSSYLFLQSIRFNDYIKVTIHEPKTLVHNSFVPPFSLQLLLENAIKHNVISQETPLCIDIYAEDDYLVVKNNIRLRPVQVQESTGIGNKNLADRYNIICDKVPLTYIEGGYYYVRIPIIRRETPIKVPFPDA